jgi:hypothetical protein
MTNINEEKAFEALDEQIVLDKITPIVEKRAEEIAEKKAQEKLSSFARTIAGEPDDKWGWSGKDRSGNPAPLSWEEGAAKIAAKAKEEAKQEIMSDLDKKEQERKRQEELHTEVRKKELDQTISEWDEDWRALTDEGEMPRMSEETAKLIKAGKVAEVDPQTDPGLKARWELLQAAKEYMDKTGKKVNLYRFYKTDYKKNPGMNAPVFGGGRGHVEEDSDLTYDQIHGLSKTFIR